MKLLLGTLNKWKLLEYKALIGSPPYQITSLSDEGVALEVEESGSTYEENATLKAKAYASHSGLIALADDSGLEVDILNNAPGHLSSRYAGPEAADEENIDRLLGELENVPWDKRTSRFVCVIAVATPSGELELFRGSCEGLIAFQRSGTEGFGYDPIFFVPSLDKTMAQLTPGEKNLISHRAEAMRRALPFIDRLFQHCSKI